MLVLEGVQLRMEERSPGASIHLQLDIGYPAKASEHHWIRLVPANTYYKGYLHPLLRSAYKLLKNPRLRDPCAGNLDPCRALNEFSKMLAKLVIRVKAGFARKALHACPLAIARFSTKPIVTVEAESRRVHDASEIIDRSNTGCPHLREAKVGLAQRTPSH